MAQRDLFNHRIMKKLILILAVLCAAHSAAHALAKYVNGSINYNTDASFETVPSDPNYLIDQIQIWIRGPETKTLTHNFSPTHNAVASGSYSPTLPGVYTIRAVARQVNGSTVQTEYTRVDVINRDPVVSSFSCATTANMGESLALTIDAHDPDKNLSEVRVYRKLPKGGGFDLVRTLSAVNNELVDTTFTLAVDPGHGSGAYQYYAEAIDAVGAKKRSATQVSTAINPRKTYVIKSQMYPKPGMEGWFSPGPVTTTTVHVRKYREDD